MKPPLLLLLRGLVSGVRALGLSLLLATVAAADGEIVASDTIIVRAAPVGDPRSVRYAWKNAPEATLFNDARLPAAPFRQEAN